MRKRGYVAVVGLCSLGLLTPAVARAANCTDGQPFTFKTEFAGLPLKFKAVCKGEWQVNASLTLQIPAKFTVDVSATEDNTGKECHTTMVTPTGGTDDFEVQQTTCKFTKDQQVKFSFKAE